MIKPYNDQEKKTAQVQRMFNQIAPTYDRLNRIISLGLDSQWRREVIDLLAPYQPREVLDVATGTGDLAIDLASHIPSITSILGIDISEQMIRYGEEKVRALALDRKITFRREDCTDLSFHDESYDAVTVAFGIRNVEDILRAISELYRVLRPSRPLIILELTEPKNFIMRIGYKLYARKFIPWVGKLLSRDKKAYDYLPRSIAAAPQREKMVEILRGAGFREAYCRSLGVGACAVYLALK